MQEDDVKRENHIKAFMQNEVCDCESIGGSWKLKGKKAKMICMGSNKVISLYIPRGIQWDSRQSRPSIVCIE
jgi:hypothetical protein